MPLLLVLLAVLLGGGQEPDEDVAREWRVREWALAPSDHGAALDAALHGAEWEERAAALDALARHLEAGGELADAPRRAVHAALTDPHPGVRAAALVVLGFDEGAEFDDASLARLAEDPLPLVRLHFARALGSAATPRRGEVLARLALDAEDRVAGAARAALFGGGGDTRGVRPLAASEVLSVLSELERRRDEEALLAAFASLVTGGATPDLLAALRALYTGDDRRSRGWRALVEAVAFVGKADAASAGEPPEAKRLVDGWLGAEAWIPRRQALLTAAAHGGGEEVARLLLAALAALESDPGGEARRASRTPGLLADVRAVAEEEGAGALEHVGPELAEALGGAVPGKRLAALLLEADPGPRTLALVLVELGRSLEAWDPDLAAAWLDQGRAESVRVAAVKALAATLVRNGDAGAGRLLVQALDDPARAVEARAWRALCDADDPAPGGEALCAAWRRLPAEERLARLGWMTRAHAYPAFRRELLAHGEFPDTRRAAAGELLAPFRGDVEVRDAMVRWLDDELARRRAALEEGLGDESCEEIERRLQAVVQGLGRVDPEGSRDALERALVQSRGWSTEVGKVAAAALGFTRDGRRRLHAYLGAETDRRTRIEAAIVLAPHGAEADPAAAVEVLIGGYPSAAGDLRVRMLPALGAAGTARAFAFLREQVHTGDEAARVAALHELAERGGAAEVPFLEDAVRRAPHLETRRVAVRLLPVADRAGATARVAQLFAELGAGLLAPDRASEERALLRSELLSALGAGGRFPRALEGEWLRRPLEAAAAELRHRFRDEDLPSERFRWRGELELASHLAAAGTLGEVLARAGPWWRMDGRFLAALADEAADDTAAGGMADRLRRAAVIAMAGERTRNERRLALARGQLLGRAWQAKRWGEAARLARGILGARRLGDFPDQVWIRLFGSRDPLGGVDPAARLASAEEQARAWGARERGDVEAARRHAERAAQRVGASGTARAEQAKLRAALAGR